ncbi:MAG TPA: MBL fold metallo-hydrolase [Ktedonobacteraceae bacterium]|nr:MBL fold metallo-hydrolase [Ktedonobacteraceae bacterium]
MKQLRPGVWEISHPFQGQEEIVGSYLLAGGDELAIVDPGPGSMVESLLASIREAGFDPQDVTHILATHVHLDHAGNAGTLVRLMPKARVYAHSLGAPHLLDTTRVVASASRIFGDRMKLLWGEIEPTPYERLRVVEHGDTLNVAGRRLEVHYTPGHAIHHVSFFDAHFGEAFVGDVAGARLQGVPYVRPPTPPPDLDLEAWSASIELLKNLRPDVLYIGHYGAIRDIGPHLAELQTRLYAWAEYVLAAMRDGKTEAEITSMLIEQNRAELLCAAQGDERALDRYEIATNYPMTVQGYMRYWRKKHPERLATVPTS